MQINVSISIDFQNLNENWARHFEFKNYAFDCSSELFKLKPTMIQVYAIKCI